MELTPQSIVLAAAVLGALAFIGKTLWRGFRYAEAVHRLVERELTPNGGGSLHDKITRTDERFAEHVIEAAADRERLARVERHLGLSA